MRQSGWCTAPMGCLRKRRAWRNSSVGENQTMGDLSEKLAWHGDYAIKGLTLYPFKGKGQVAARIRNLEQGIGLLRESMGLLVQRTKDVRHRTFALCLVRQNGAEKLLWRLGAVKNGPRRVWRDADLQELLAQQPNMRNWYAEINGQVLVLNMQALNLRREVRLLEQLLLQMEEDDEVGRSG